MRTPNAASTDGQSTSGRLISALRRSRSVAILRASTPRHLGAASHLLFEAGFDAVEMPLTTPDVWASIAAVRESGVAGVVGAGTVLTGEQAKRAADAGAEFLVTPGVCPDVLEFAAHADMPVITGCFSPTEVLAALRAGSELIKLFPAVTLGVEYARQLLGPFPNLQFVPTGGVQLTGASAWLDAGAIALGLGTPLVGDTLETGDLTELASRANTWRRMLSGSDVLSATADSG